MAKEDAVSTAEMRKFFLEKAFNELETHTKGITDFLKWTVAISTGVMIFSKDTLDSLGGEPIFQMLFVVGLGSLFISIINAVLCMNHWIGFGLLRGEIFLKLSFRCAPTSNLDTMIEEEATAPEKQKELDKLMQELMQEWNREALRGNRLWYCYVAAFIFGLLFITVAWVVPVINQSIDQFLRQFLRVFQ